MKPEYGKVYTFTVPGEPVPKSTQKPPRHKAAYHIVQNDPKYKRLKETWAYQSLVAECATLDEMPTFRKDDPIRLSLCICKVGRKLGDVKNILASIEDGLQYGKFIPNDKQIVGYGDVITHFNNKTPYVTVRLEIHPIVFDRSWREGYFGSKKKAQEYYDRVVKHKDRIE